jgi:hypothetical protein
LLDLLIDVALALALISASRSVTRATRSDETPRA